MVRWEVVPEQDSIAISFFKIQYKKVGKNTVWETADPDISAHLTSHPVTHLTPGTTYKFRVAAVYINNDSRNGPTSDKFTLLLNPPIKKPRDTPVILSSLAVSPSAIEIQWMPPREGSTALDGFYIHYRQASFAGDYYTESIPGANTNSHIISHLLPDTAYEVKIQTFNAAGPSDFSNIVTNKTLPSTAATTTTSTEAPIKPLPPSTSGSGSQGNFTMYLITGLTCGIAIMIIFVGTTLICLNLKQKQEKAAIREARKTKPPKERHPKANSSHNLNQHHFSKPDYSNGSGSGSHGRSNGLNGSLARSVNGLAVKGNGYVYRDSVETARNEITIRVNPDSEDLRIDFEGRSRTLTSTTFVGGRSHSSKDLRKSNHNLDNISHFNERCVDREPFERETMVSSKHHLPDMNGHATIGSTTSRRKMVVDEVHPNGVRSSNRSTSFSRLNGTLERKKRSPLQREDAMAMMCSSSGGSGNPSTSPSASSTSSSANTDNSKISGNNNHPISHQHMIGHINRHHPHYHHNNNDGLLTTHARSICSRHTNGPSNGPLVIMQSSC